MLLDGFEFLLAAAEHGRVVCILVTHAPDMSTLLLAGETEAPRGGGGCGG